MMTKTLSLAGLAAAVSGCTGRASAEDPTATQTTTNDWNGGALNIFFDGVPSPEGRPFVEVLVDPKATRVTATATFAVDGDTAEEIHERLAVVSKRFALTEVPQGVSVTCSYPPGDADPHDLGCTSLRVTIPPGTVQQSHTMYLFARSGDMRVAETGPPPVIGSIQCQALHGEAVVNVLPVPGALSAFVSADGMVDVGLPETIFIWFSDIASKEEDTRIVTDDFSGLQYGKPWPHPPPADPSQPSLESLLVYTTSAAEGGHRPATARLRKFRLAP